VKNAIGSIRWHIPENPPIGAKISQKSFTQTELKTILSHILLPWQRESLGENAIAAFAGPSPKLSFRCKNLADISYTDPVIANFVPNFVAVATEVGWGKMQLAAFDGASPKTPL